MSIRKIFNEKIDLVKLANRYGVNLEPFGDDYIGRCLFQGCRRKRSFVVRRLEREYECLSCGATGDAIDFMDKAVGFIRRRGIEVLVREFNIQIDEVMPPKPMPVWQQRAFVAGSLNAFASGSRYLMRNAYTGGMAGIGETEERKGM